MPSRRRRRILLIALTALSWGWTAAGAAGEGLGLPTPPGQDEPWTPPATKLPRFLVSATATLFEQGLADPRDCDYRSIEVEVGEIWGPGAGKTRTHGWVLPKAEGRREDFAVCWNGLVYPVASLGDRADLDGDLRALVGSLEASRAEVRKNGPGHSFGGFTGPDAATSEVFAVSVKEQTSLKLCLLLRLGRVDLAESLFAACTLWKPDGAPRDVTDYGISYLTLAYDWAWYLFDRAIGAHMRGDDRIALADSRLLVDVSRKIEARAAAMGFPRSRPSAERETAHPYLVFLGQLDAFRADQERRAREPRRREVAPRDAGAAQRIAALIRDLDQVAERQNSQPGWVDLTRAATVQALIAHGEGAVEPLLEVLESDNRLTRSVGFGRSQERFRTILGVHEAAYKGLVAILGTANFGEGSSPVVALADPERRAKQSGLIRAYWEKNKGLSPAERWYRTLNNDAATPAQWQEVAASLVRPAGARDPRPARAIDVPDLSRPGRGAAVALRGDPLRLGRDPSVSDLLARRTLDLARPDRVRKPGESPPLTVACDLALALYRWDPAAARPVLTIVMNRCHNDLAGPAAARDPTQRQILSSNICRAAGALAASGDLAAADRAAEIVRSFTTQDILIAPGGMLDLMVGYPKRRAIAAAADWFFNDVKSPWMGELYRTRLELLGRPGYLRRDLLGVAGYRKRLGVLLDDATVLGTITIREANNRQTLEIRLGDRPSRPDAAARPDPSAPRVVSQNAFRACDYVAWQLSTHGSAIAPPPPFRLDWPLERRDAALEAIRQALKQLDR